MELLQAAACDIQDILQGNLQHAETLQVSLQLLDQSLVTRAQVTQLQLGNCVTCLWVGRCRQSKQHCVHGWLMVHAEAYFSMVWIGHWFDDMQADMMK